MDIGLRSYEIRFLHKFFDRHGLVGIQWLRGLDITIASFRMRWNNAKGHHTTRFSGFNANSNSAVKRWHICKHMV